MESLYVSCCQCSKLCGINRASGQVGFCGETQAIKVAWAGLHFGEEPPITGKRGSGTIFITGCNLRCSFCQNFQISQEGMGTIVSIQTFSEICLGLERMGAENINVVTGSHAIPEIAQGLRLAKQNGLSIPILWNSSAYESLDSLKLLKDLVDVWLPDLKTLNPDLALQMSAAADYPQVATKAIEWMVANRPLVLEKKDGDDQLYGKIVSGVIVRHLVLPEKIAETIHVLEWLSKKIKNKAMFSIMTQYTPVEKSPKHKNLTAFESRYINNDEFNDIQDMLDIYELDQGFYQELVQDSQWLPDFSKMQPFSSDLAKPLWHWKKGFV